MQHVTVQVKLGEYAFQGRAVESLDVRQAVGEHAECTLVFDRDPRATQSETAQVEAAKLADAGLQVVFSESLGGPSGGAGGGPVAGAAAAAANSVASAALGGAVRTGITGDAASSAGPSGAPGSAGDDGAGDGGAGAAPGDGTADGVPVGMTTGTGFAGAGGAGSPVAGMLAGVARTGITNRIASSHFAPSFVTGTVANAAGAQVGRVVDGIGSALAGNGHRAAPAAASAAAANAAANGAGANGAPFADGAAAGDDSADSAPAPGSSVEFLAFDGQVREVRVEYRPDGAARFTIVAFSRSYELGAHADQRYFPKQTVAGLAGALDLAVAGQVPAGAARDYIQRGESDWAFVARVAAGEGLQLRPTWGRRPGETAPHPAEVAQGFASETHEVTWGRDLVEFAVTGRPTNHGVTSAFTDPATKHTHRFRGVRKSPQWLGGAKPLVSALEQAATKDAGGGDPGNVDVGGLGGTRARTLEEFRTRLERASEARLGGAIEATGASTDPSLRAGDRIEVTNGAGGGLLPTSWDYGADERKGTYGLIRVQHHWENGLYRNTFTATPWAGYHPTPRAIEEGLARAAAALGGADAGGNEHAHGGGAWGAGSGVTLATVFDDDDPKKLGRVRVQYAYQEGQEASHWLRVAGHGGGKGHGAGHVPLKGNMVAVAPVRHDEEHPLVIGAVYDQTDAGGQTKDRIQVVSRSGSGLSLNTGQGGASDHVELHTPGGKTMVHLLDNLITIHSEGDISIEAPNGELRIRAKSMTTAVDTDVVRGVKGDVHDTVQGSVVRAVKGDLHDTVQGSVVRDITGDVHDTVQGEVVRTVTGDSSTTAANVAVTSRGKMDATASGTHTIKGGQVKIN